jgi:hypothetical protein
MDRNLFLPLSWEELRWWMNTSKRLVNDISGGRPCGAHSVVTKVEDYFKAQLELLSCVGGFFVSSDTRWS